MFSFLWLWAWPWGGNTLQHSCPENPTDRGAWQSVGSQELDTTERLSHNHHHHETCFGEQNMAEMIVYPPWVCGAQDALQLSSLLCFLLPGGRLAFSIQCIRGRWRTWGRAAPAEPNLAALLGPAGAWDKPFLLLTAAETFDCALPRFIEATVNPDADPPKLIISSGTMRVRSAPNPSGPFRLDSFSFVYYLHMVTTWSLP